MINNINKYENEVLKRIKLILENQKNKIILSAEKFYQIYKNNGMIYLFGTGHSHMLAEEGHFRAGGFAPICPILFSGLMLHEGSIVSSDLERTKGISTSVLKNYKIKPKDLLVVFTNSGVNQAPLEAALYAKELNCFTIGISSLEYSKIAPKSNINSTLDEIVDIFIDNFGPPGDSLIEVDNFKKVAPFSTIGGSFIFNSIISHVAELCKNEEIFPFYISGNMPQATEHNEKLLKLYMDRNPHIWKKEINIYVWSKWTKRY